MIPTPPARQQLPLSAAQREMWYGQQADPGNPVFTMGDFLELRGPLDTARFTAAWQGVLREAGTLRARFTEHDGEPRQELAPAGDFPVETLDLSQEPQPREAAEAFMREDLLTPPDLTAGTLRSVLLRLGPEHALFYIRVNHILVDGFSRVLIYNRLAALYTDPDAEGAFPEPQTLTDDEAAFAQTAKYAKEKAFWRSRFEEQPEPVSLSQRPGGPARGSLRCEAVLPSDTVERLRALAWDSRITWQTLLIAATGAYVQRAAGVDRALLTLAVPARATAAARAVPGMRANFVPHPVQVLPGRTVADFLRDSAVELRSTLRHQNYRGDRIRRDLGFTGDAGRSLGPTVNVLESGFDYAFGECTGLLHNLSTGPVEDLQIIYLDSAEEGYAVRLDANPSRYTQQELELHQRRLFGWLRTLAEAGPQAVVDRLDVLLPAESETVRAGWNATAIDEAYAGVVERVRALAVDEPAKTAVQDPQGSVSYGELVRLASALSRRLVAAGVGPGSRVAMLCEPGIPFVTGILAVLGAGAAWVPLDLRAPQARTAALLGDSRADVLYVGPGHTDTAAEILAAASHAPTVVAWDGSADDELAAPAGGADDLAYIIFTSGSTGRPKGAMVHRAGMVNHLLAKVDDLGLTSDDVVVHNAPVTFDISVWQMLCPLVTGGRLVVVDGETAADPQELFGRVTTDGVTILEVVPSLLRAAVDSWQAGTPRPSLDGLRSLMVTGEALPADLAVTWGEIEPVIPLVNAYGPTECSDDVTHAVIHAGSDIGSRAPIGHPVRNTRLYVLDAALQPVPPGTPGELYVAGAGVGHGYLDDPGKTAVTFLADPFALEAGARMYRTGDRVRQRPDGQLEFLERTDHQVKIRGHRIELGEIETALRRLPGITDAAAAVHHGRLVGYLIGATPDARTALGATLPGYMVPSTFVTLDALPLTPNGKVDRKALPVPDPSTAASGLLPARNAREQALCEIFAEVLGLPAVGIDDSFFDLGGHSLLATKVASRIRARLGAEVSIRTFFQAPTVAELATRLDDAAAAVRPALTAAAERPAELPLSPAQQRLWFLNQLENGSATYHLPFAVRLSGALDVDALHRALGDVLARHESLRTVFPDDGGRPRQRVVPTGEAHLGLPVTGTSREALPERLTAAASRGFDLAAELPLRTELFKLADDEHVLLLVLHHIASDGWSVAPLARDLAEAYALRRSGGAPDWAPLPVQYADYTLWQRELLDTVSEEQLAYWREVLEGIPEELELPYDRPRPTVPSHRGATVEFHVDGELHAAVAELARTQGASTFMVLQAMLATLLSSLGAGEDIPLGSPVAGRTDPALDELVGFFVNTLVLRTDLSGDPTFRELLDRVRTSDLAAYTHQDLPFEALVDALAPSRSLSRQPLFQTMLVLQNNASTELALPGLEVETVPVRTGTAKLDLAFELTERQGPDGAPAGIDAVLEYSSDLFDQATARSFADRFAHLVGVLTGDPDLPLGRVDPLLPAERERILGEWAGPVQHVDVAPVHELYAARAAAQPEHPALQFGEQVLSYAELDARANRLAHELAARGTGPGDLVALLLPRSPEMVVALLAVLKAGAAYLPIDAAYPRDRIAYMLEDARPALALTTAAESVGLDASAAPLLLLDDPEVRAAVAARPARALTDADRTRPLTVRDPAYVIYTSGSTGRPKGVVVEHRTVAVMVADQGPRMGIGPATRWLQFASYSFDAATWELAIGLLSGATMVLSTAEERGPGEPLAELVERTGTTMVCLPPTVLSAWPDDRPMPEGVQLVVAGEACPPELVERFSRGRVMRNAYGPTEATVCASISEPLSGAVKPPIGSPLHNTRLYVLDARLRPVAPGVTGELYIGGDQLARGYLRRPGLTANRFLADPFATAPGGRMYRSGDLVRWNADGSLDYVGRVDDQVKLRGFRIEPGEIEGVLLARDDIARAAVIVREDRPGDKRLVAYVVAAGAHADVREIRAQLAAELPEHMVPSAVVALDALPLTGNGKLDRRALPAPDYTAVAAGLAPANEREAALCRAFAEVLGLESAGADASFFDLGGDSISSIQLVGKAREFGLAITAQDVFVHRTPQGLALAAAAAGQVETVGVGEGTGPVPATPITAWFDAIPGPTDGFHQAAVVRTPADASYERIAAALQTLLDHHDVLRWSGEGIREAGAVRAEDVLRRVAAPGDPASPLRQEAEAARGELAPREGDVLRAVWFDAGAGRPGRLLLTLHHLVVDGVSWRILLPDLAQAYEHPQRPLTPVGTSFRQWAHLLHEEAVQDERRAELPLWQEMLAPGDPLIGARPLDPALDTMGTAHRLRLELPAEYTAELLTSVPAAFHAEINDVLLTALALAVADWRRGRGEAQDVLVDLEGHGREAVVPGVDLTRTVGWFTSTHPVRLDVGLCDWDEVHAGGPALGQALKEVKEQLRRVPDHGIGHGLLSRLGPDTAPVLGAYPAPQLGFNYLGRMALSEPADWQLTPESLDVAAGTDPGMPLPHALGVNARTEDRSDGPRLVAEWAWAGRTVADADAEAIAHGWFRALKALSAHAARPDAGGFTPSDLGLVEGLEQDEIDEFENEFAHEWGTEG
ncbi:amino acid adenylation domain-containing protein [Streptomyces sp. TRM66268-LWL]|uniref:Amino acid adenylation domain-containing protein n=1 Tax=Streptomyces polyasparticus TaxID=2767826 RepID=A0ABR7S673_9ACTN|nr:non-ribosomal peptide synthetase [Streptomyces polyasparticus]MBC9710976.1 amino acid adenylation domain-containing protein [Streptomyces polyasparticus]